MYGKRTIDPLRLTRCFPGSGAGSTACCKTLLTLDSLMTRTISREWWPALKGSTSTSDVVSCRFRRTSSTIKSPALHVWVGTKGHLAHFHVMCSGRCRPVDIVSGRNIGVWQHGESWIFVDGFAPMRMYSLRLENLQYQKYGREGTTKPNPKIIGFRLSFLDLGIASTYVSFLPAERRSPNTVHHESTVNSGVEYIRLDFMLRVQDDARKWEAGISKPHARLHKAWRSTPQRSPAYCLAPIVSLPSFPYLHAASPLLKSTSLILLLRHVGRNQRNQPHRALDKAAEPEPAGCGIWRSSHSLFALCLSGVDTYVISVHVSQVPGTAYRTPV
jgi:hypothetical protein